MQSADLGWWLGQLCCCGALYLGEEITVAFGNKASGTNHVLPTSGAARSAGGLLVHRYVMLVTWQRATRESARQLAEATAQISRLECTEGHTRTGDIRRAKFRPGESFDLRSRQVTSAGE